MDDISKKGKQKFFALETGFVVKILSISDVFMISGLGLISPIFAIYITNNIKGAGVEVVGIAWMVYLLTKSLGQLITGQMIDRIKGEKDDFWAMVTGAFGASLVPIFYIFARTPFHIYLIQFFYGISQALAFPAWMAIFTRHINPERQGIEWGIYYTLVDLAGAAMVGLGGIIAGSLGFKPLFLGVSFLSFLGSSWLFLIRSHLKGARVMKKKKKREV